MARLYYKEDVTVLSYNGNTGMVDDLGSGTLEITTADVENSALMDDWTDTSTTKKTATFEGELAADSTRGNWFTQVGSTGALAFVDTETSVSGTFLCTKASKVLGDALRWNVSLKSKGTVTVA
jgi:hypothetical protein